MSITSSRDITIGYKFYDDENERKIKINRYVIHKVVNKCIEELVMDAFFALTKANNNTKGITATDIADGMNHTFWRSPLRPDEKEIGYFLERQKEKGLVEIFRPGNYLMSSLEYARRMENCNNNTWEYEEIKEKRHIKERYAQIIQEEEEEEE